MGKSSKSFKTTLNPPMFNTYSGETKPPNPTDGAMYFDTINHDMYAFHGGQWRRLYNAMEEPRWTDKLKETLNKL